MAVENYGKPYLGPRPHWCPECEGLAAVFVCAIDDEFDLIQCHAAKLHPHECSAEPFAGRRLVNTSAGKSDWEFVH